MKQIGLIAIIFLFTSCFGVKKQFDACLKELKVGTFYYYDGTQILELKRTESYQIETDPTAKSVSEITWISENAYELRYDSEKSTINTCLKDGDKMLIIISNCSPDYYTASITTEKCGVEEAQIFRDKKKLKKALEKYTE